MSIGPVQPATASAGTQGFSNCDILISSKTTAGQELGQCLGQIPATHIPQAGAARLSARRLPGNECIGMSENPAITPRARPGSTGTSPRPACAQTQRAGGGPAASALARNPVGVPDGRSPSRMDAAMPPRLEGPWPAAAGSRIRVRRDGSRTRACMSRVALLPVREASDRSSAATGPVELARPENGSRPMLSQGGGPGRTRSSTPGQQGPAPPGNRSSPERRVGPRRALRTSRARFSARHSPSRSPVRR